jgi:hypothetical protein
LVDVGLFEGGGLAIGQGQVERGDGFGQVVGFGRAAGGLAGGGVSQKVMPSSTACAKYGWASSSAAAQSSSQTCAAYERATALVHRFGHIK